jgi:2-isopropylmalate synthase
MAKNNITIFDTTLRDGEQSPGASLTIDQKVTIAHQLVKLGVNVIEAGFPVSSPAQFEAVKRIADECGHRAIIAGLTRAKEEDIKAAAEALKGAPKFRIHTFIGVSDQHVLGKFGDARYGETLAEKRRTVLKMAADSIALAKTYTPDVEWSAEDALRTDFEFLVESVHNAVAAGATTINIPDTTGFAYPEHYGSVFRKLLERVPELRNLTLSSHCHDDLGLSVANSLFAIENGARQVECTINGIGERAGNASLEEIVMALRVRADHFPYTTSVVTEELCATSRMVSESTGMLVQPNKAIVGRNAFSHESGIHQDGVIKNRSTYEIMTPESVGAGTSTLFLGRHSGQHGLKVRLKELGFEPDAEEMKVIYKKFSELADRKKEITNEDLQLLMGANVVTEETYQLELMQVTSGTMSLPTSSVVIRTKDKVLKGSALGEGPVEATLLAIDNALGIKFQLENYQVKSVSSGVKAKGEASVRIRWMDRVFEGRGLSVDVLEASARAYLDAVNQQIAFEDLRKAAELKKYKDEVPTSLAW